jgi:copper chaperone
MGLREPAPVERRRPGCQVCGGLFLDHYEDLQVMDLEVKGMHCQSCVKAIKRAIQALDDQASVDVDLAQSQVKVLASSLSAGDLQAAIEDAGFEVTSLCP